MNKSILAAVAAALIVAPAANASVTIYGTVHVSIDYTQGELSFGPVEDSWDRWSVTSRSSRIGFKGTEDLGNGLSLIWKAETGYDFSDGGAWQTGCDTFGNCTGRNAYIGLTGDWGTFLYGRHDTPYKIAFYSTGIDMMADTVIDMNAQAFGVGFHEVRASNAIAYISPNMNGVTIAAAIIPGEGDASSNGGFGVGDGLADAYSVAGMYANNGLRLAVAYEDLAGDFPIDMDKIFAGGSYSMNNMTFALAYQDWNLAILDLESYGAAFGYGFGNNKLVVNYAYLDFGSLFETNAWGVGLEHSLSKRTKAYAAYSDLGFDITAEPDDDPLDIEIGVDTKVFSVGMIHNF